MRKQTHDQKWDTAKAALKERFIHLLTETNKKISNNLTLTKPKMNRRKIIKIKGKINEEKNNTHTIEKNQWNQQQVLWKVKLINLSPDSSRKEGPDKYNQMKEITTET